MKHRYAFEHWLHVPIAAYNLTKFKQSLKLILLITRWRILLLLLDQLMVGSPDYESLVPSSGARPSQSKKKKLKKLLKDSDDEDEDSCDEMRVCGVCEELLVRRLARMQSERKKIVTVLYDKMDSLMTECDRLKPSYLEMAESLL